MYPNLYLYEGVNIVFAELISACDDAKNARISMSGNEGTIAYRTMMMNF